MSALSPESSATPGSALPATGAVRHVVDTHGCRDRRMPVPVGVHVDIPAPTGGRRPPRRGALRPPGLARARFRSRTGGRLLRTPVPDGPVHVSRRTEQRGPPPLPDLGRPRGSGGQRRDAPPEPGFHPTRVKLGLVLLLTLNGLQAGLLNRRMTQQGTAALTPRLISWGASTALISQVCWWGAVIIGFRNSQR